MLIADLTNEEREEKKETSTSQIGMLFAFRLLEAVEDDVFFHDGVVTTFLLIVKTDLSNLSISIMRKMRGGHGEGGREGK